MFRRLFLWLALLLFYRAQGQELPAAYKKLSGTLSNVVYCVVQDRTGYIWVGTEAGVSRYDGYAFRHFSKEDGLSDNDIFQIHQDRKGRLWFLTYNGEPTVYDNGRMLTPRNTPFLARVKPGNMATGFVENGDTISYITLGSIYMFVKDSLYKTIPAPYNPLTDKGPAYFLYGMVWNNSTYYVSQQGWLTPRNETLVKFPGSHSPSQITAKMRLIDGKLIATGSRSVYVLDMHTNKPVEFSLPDNFLALSVWPGVNAHTALVFTNRSLFLYDTEKNTLQPYTGNTLPSVTSVLRDREGNTWMGSLTNGLYFAGNYPAGNFNYTTAAGTKTAYSLQVFNDVVYAGYANAEFVGCNKPGFTYQTTNRSDYTTPPRVYGFCATPRSLWVAAGSRAVELDASGKLLRQLAVSSKAIAVNKNRDLYVALSYSLIRLPLDSLGENNIITNNVPALYNGRVNHIYSNNSDTVLLGTLRGLVMLVRDKIVPNAYPARSIFQTTVTRIIQTKFGLAFSTLGEGVGLLTPDSLYIINKQSGLFNNSCNSIYAAGDTLWVATTLGLNRVVIEKAAGMLQFSVKNYAEAQGLPASKINDVVVYRDTVWAATENGVCHLPVKEGGAGFLSPQLVLEGFTVNGQAVDYFEKLSLGYDQNNIRIRFTGLSFFSNGAIIYKYKLEGADENWNTTTSREVEYPALPPGKYHFLVMAANANGVWNDTPARIDFEILPPYWKTWWFRLILLLGSLALILLVVRYRFAQQRQKHEFQKKNLILEKEKAEFEMENLEYEKQLIELEQQALRLQMNPHFIFNAITAIQGLYAANKATAAKEYLVRFSRLLRTLFDTARLPVVPLSKELELVKDYVELSIPRLEHGIEYIQHIQEGLVPEMVAIPPMLIQPFIENALLHGLLPLKREGRLTLTVNRNGEMLIFIIEDNGVGRQENPPHRLGRPHGLSITRQRIDLLNRFEEKAGGLQIEDLKDVEGKPCGTRITFHTKCILLNDPNDYR